MELLISTSDMQWIIEARVGCRRSDWSLCLFEKEGKSRSMVRYSVHGIQNPSSCANSDAASSMRPGGYLAQMSRQAVASSNMVITQLKERIAHFHSVSRDI